MSESSKVKAKAPKKEQSKDISIWWILIVLVIIALVFSIVAVVIALHYTNVQLEDYAKKDMLNNYAKKDDFDGNCDRWADGSDKVVKYADSVQLQSSISTGKQTGFLTNQQSGNAQFMDCGPGVEPGDTMNFKVFKNTTGCSFN